MIVRYHVECDSCATVTALRLSVGHGAREPFQFSCSRCHNLISGHHLLDQENAKVLGPEIIGAKETKRKDVSHSYSHNPDYPGLGHSDADEHRSSFIESFARLGEGGFRNLQRAAWARKFIPEHRARLRQIVSCYMADKWAVFDRIVGDLFEIPPPDNTLDRDRALYLTLELAYLPLFASESHAGHVSTTFTFVHDLYRRQATKLLNAVAALDKAGVLDKTRDAALRSLLWILDNIDSFSQALPFWSPETRDIAFPEETPISGPYPFDKLKSQYVDCYEAIHVGMTVAIVLGNVSHRQDANSFGLVPSGKPAARSISHFLKLPNAPKAALLTEPPWLQAWIAPVLNPKLRNAIGHNSASFDHQSGVVRYPTTGNTSHGRIVYGQFLTDILRMHLVLHQLNHLVKILRVFDRLRPDPTAGAASIH